MVATAYPGSGDDKRSRWRRLAHSPRRILSLSTCGVLLVQFAGSSAHALPVATNKDLNSLWVLKPVVRPAIPAGVTQSTNPIDAFIGAQYQAKSLVRAEPADKRTLLRRVCLDLTGLPPTPEEQEAFLKDTSPDAYEKVVDRLLSSDQHAVRYARHWLDVLRYSDTDDKMVAAPGIYLWRDWVIRALADDMPYDQFVRAQLTGYRSDTRTQITATGYRVPAEPRPEDIFALGFLARGGSSRDVKDDQELAINAVETVSTAFMGMTVGCAKCHDHMYDPISQRDYYAMKALFDPLVLRKITLATADDLFAAGKAQAEGNKKRAAIEGPMNELIAPYKKKLYEDRVAMLPPDVQDVIRKPEKERTAQEQKIADDYYPILRIDPEKIEEVMSEDEKKKYIQMRKQIEPKKTGRRRDSGVPACWTVEVDRARELEKSYILTSGNPERPETNHEITPGWPFGPAKPDFREGRVEAFSDWLTAPENPLFARVAVNRLWQWHFGQGLQKNPSDFGILGGAPSNPQLLDWLAAEFASRHFNMKEMHRLMVTSDTYKLASVASSEIAAADAKTDPDDTYLWRFRLQRLDAEPIWDSIFAAAGSLDLAVGGPSFDVRRQIAEKHDDKDDQEETPPPARSSRRAAYMTRGFSSNRDAMPSFLQAFDVDDGRVPCPLRTQTVTAPQSLFLMNGEEIEQASAQFAERLEKHSAGDLKTAIDLAYEFAISRPPSASERDKALAYLQNDPARLKNFAWLLFNLDEF
ncbi:MAG TPA: DUF1549 and DUF1553 domain-containing protein, partial [Verrucomicrobiae bacterium]|nr:DUF1549 and DUF1553 domain-containing protein [Verrucomicrobiae bacterium]